MAGRFSVEAVFRAVDKMTAPVARMSRSIGQFAKTSTREMQAVSSFGGSMFTGLKYGAVAAVAALGTVGVALNSVSNRADDLLMRSQRLNFNIENLQEWQFVAEQTGLTIEEFDTALDKFGKTLGAAKLGTGTLATVLKKSNPQLLRQLKATTDTGEAFEIYLKYLRSIPDVHKRNALAAAAFGKSGDKVNNIVTETEDVIASLRAEARANGLMSLKGAQAAEAFGDSLNSLKRAGTGLMQSVFIPLMPMLTSLLKSAREWVITNREVISEKFLHGLTWIVANFSTIVDVSKKIGIAIGIFMVWIGVLNTLVGVLTLVNLVMAANPLTLWILGITLLIVAVAAAVIWWDELMASFGKMPLILQLILSPLVGIAGIFKGFIFLIKLVIVLAGALYDAFARLGNDLVDELTPVYDFFVNLFGFLGHIVDRVKQALGFGAKLGLVETTGEDTGAVSPGPRVVSPQERNALMVNETRTTSTAELLIRDDTGRGVLKQPRNNPTLIDMIQSGTF